MIQLLGRSAQACIFGVAFVCCAAAASAQVPPPWATQDINATNGSASFDTGTEVWTVIGEGTDIWDMNDEFRYVHLPLSGDAELIAQVLSIQNTNVWAKGGVMIRETLTGGSTHAFMMVTPGNGSGFQRRTATGGASANDNNAAYGAPRWVRLTRVGNVFTGYSSTDGTTWTQIGQDTIVMGASVFMGLALTSHANDTLCTATFGNVRIIEAGVVVWPPPPTNLQVTPGVLSASLSWTAPLVGTTYNVKRSSSATGPWTVIAANYTGTTYNDTGLSQGQTYYYTVSALSTGGESANSNVASTVPTAPPPRTNDHDEGLFDGKCACGSIEGIPVPWPLALLGLAFFLRRRQS